MADVRAHAQQQPPRLTEGVKSLLPDKGPSAQQVIAVATLVPLGGILLALAGITLTGTIIGLAIATPVFVIFSPVIVPAAIAIGLAVAGFLASGALGVTGLSSLAWILNYFRGMRTVPEQLEQAKRRMQEAVGQVGQRTKDVGQAVSHRMTGQESGPGAGAGRPQEAARS